MGIDRRFLGLGKSLEIDAHLDLGIGTCGEDDVGPFGNNCRQPSNAVDDGSDDSD